MKSILVPKSGSVMLRSPHTEPDLLRRLQICGMPTSWGWSFCRTAACHRCREHRTADWILEASKTYAGSRSADLRLLTVMLEPVADPTDLKRVIGQSKVAMRNIVHRLRQKDDRASELRMTGAVEVDWYRAHHIPLLTNDKVAQLNSLGFDKTASEVWLPHFHLLLDLGGSSERRLSELLLKRWPGYNQVDYRLLHDDKDTETNIANIIGYGMKHHHFYKVKPYGRFAYVAWPEEVRVRFYNEIYKAGGYSALRFNLKPSAKLDPEPKQVFDERLSREPMPIIV